MADVRPSPAPSRPPVEVRRAARWGLLAVVALFAVVVSEGTPGGLLARGPFSSDFFDAQAHALLDGRLDVDPEVAGIEGFVVDGRTHLYFGLVPALLRLPIAAVTDGFDGRLTQVSMLAALAVAGGAAGRLLWRGRRWQRGEGPVGRWEPWIVAAGVAAVGASSPLLFLAARPVVYHETELWGAATALLAVEALLRWWERPERRSLVVASLSALVAFHTRASVGGGAVVALALTLGLALLVRRLPWRQAPALALAVLLPVATYAAVNQARFDHPFSVPFPQQVLSSFDPDRQATLASTGGGLFGLEFAPTALVAYARPDGVALQRLFPWITFREDTTVVGDPVFDTIDRTASVPVVAPSLLALAVVGLAAVVRRGWRDPWLTATVGVASGLAATVTIAFIAQRYLADVTPLLVVPAAVGTWVVADGLRRLVGWRRRLAVATLVALTAAGTAVSLALALQSQRLFILPADATRRDFVATQYGLHERLRGGSPPGVRAAAQAGAPGPRGEVVLLDDCRGLYWSDGTRWWPLELGQTDGLLLDVGPRSLLEGEGWRLLVEGDGEQVSVVYRSADAARVGDPAPAAVLDGGPLTVWLDRVNSELTVRSGDRELLVAWFVDLAGPVTGSALSPLPTPLCHDLQSRLPR